MKVPFLPRGFPQDPIVAPYGAYHRTGQAEGRVEKPQNCSERACSSGFFDNLSSWNSQGFKFPKNPISKLFHYKTTFSTVPEAWHRRRTSPKQTLVAGEFDFCTVFCWKILRYWIRIMQLCRRS